MDNPIKTIGTKETGITVAALLALGYVTWRVDRHTYKKEPVFTEGLDGLQVRWGLVRRIAKTIELIGDWVT